jgi:N-terminal acetyltransferase B complex non-catalytic subunit
MALTKNQILNEKARILRKLGRCKECRDVFENLLLENPDDWSCWKGHLESSIFDDDINATQSLVDRILKKQEDAPFPLRGPYLMLVEIVTEKVRKSATPEAIQACAAAIQKYAGIFAPRVSCAFSDLENYVNMIVRSNDEAAMEATVALINFAETLRKSSATAKESDKYTNKERQSKLRAYTFAVKLMHKLLASRPDLCKRYLPDWKELVVEWRTSLSLIPSSGGEERRDMKAGDELILLIAQQLLYSGADQASLMVCSSLLEDAIANSTDNPYLKFAAIDVYHQLDAVSRAWELYDSIGIKHIQNDTCNFTIISRLLEGGLYNEVISICSQLLSFQTCTPRECGEYAGRAMECGTLSKSNEFLVFQREKMNSSLTLHYCKGAILDAAPLFATAVPGKDEGDFVMKGGLGIQQGIVGGDDDVERAINLLVHSHSPYASVSVVSWVHCFGSLDHADSLADNRDTSVLTQNAILVPPKIEKKGFMIQETLRRGHVHGILIRTALCLDAMKGPKKGKVGKPSECLKKRINSLLESVLSASEFFDTQVVFDDYENGAGCQAMLRTFLELCRVLAVIISGLPKSEEDSMEHREQSATDMLQKHATAQIKLAHENLTGTWNIKTVCSMSASYLVPVFAVFRMCSTACTIYGWGKRKQTKKVSLAMAEFSQTLNELVQDMMACVKTLPESDTAMIECPLKEEVAEIIGVEGLKKAKTIVTICQYRTRLRLEPVLQEMDEFLDEFDASKEK